MPTPSPTGPTGLTPTKCNIYTVNNTDGTVSVIDGTTNSVISTVPVGSFPLGAGILCS